MSGCCDRSRLGGPGSPWTRPGFGPTSSATTTTAIRVAERIFASSAITMRHGVADPRVDDVSSWSTGQRMARYRRRGAAARQGGAGAARWPQADLDAADIGLFTVASCTGYSTPGLDLVLARDMGMDPSVQRLMVGHMGCYAALPGAGSRRRFRGRPPPPGGAAVRRADLAAHPARDRRRLADGGPRALLRRCRRHRAAAYPTPASRGLRFVDMVAVADHSTADHMTWDITDLGFRMGLSPQVPSVLARHVGARRTRSAACTARADPGRCDGLGGAPGRPAHPRGRRGAAAAARRGDGTVVRDPRRQRQLLLRDGAHGARAAAAPSRARSSRWRSGRASPSTRRCCSAPDASTPAATRQRVATGDGDHEPVVEQARQRTFTLLGIGPAALQR